MMEVWMVAKALYKVWFEFEPRAPYFLLTSFAFCVLIELWEYGRLQKLSRT